MLALISSMGAERSANVRTAMAKYVRYLMADKYGKSMYPKAVLILTYFVSYLDTFASKLHVYKSESFRIKALAERGSRFARQCGTLSCVGSFV